MKNPDPLLTAEQLAELWQLDVSTVRRRTRRREIPAVNIGTDKRPVWRYDPGPARPVAELAEVRMSTGNLETVITAHGPITVWSLTSQGVRVAWEGWTGPEPYAGDLTIESGPFGMTLGLDASNDLLEALLGGGEEAVFAGLDQVLDEWVAA